MSIEDKIEELTAAITALTAAIGKASTCGCTTAKADAPKAEKKEPAKKDEPKAEAKKEEAPVEQPAPAVESAKPVEQPAAAAQTNTPAANAPTYEDVKAAFLALNQKKGREATVAALNQAGVATVPELQSKPENFAKAIEIAKKAAE